MLDMMQRMMGQGQGEGEGQGQGQGQGQGEGNGGEGMTGDSDAPNRKIDGSATGNSGTRTVPKKSGSAGSGLPPEFNKALDAYNRLRPKDEQP